MLTLLRKLPLLLLLLLLICGCSTRKNNKYTRWYHGFTTRYNGYYHAEKKYNEQIAAINDRIAIPEGKDFAEFYVLLAPGNLLVEQTDADVFLDVAKRCENLIAKHSVAKPPRRDRRKQNDIDYQRYLRRKEFNPMMHRVWLLKQKALLLGGSTNEAIKTGRTIEQHFAHDTSTLIQSRIVSAVAYSLKGWIYAAHQLLTPLQYRSDAVYVCEMLLNHELYYLQLQSRIPSLIETSVSAQQKSIIIEHVNEVSSSDTSRVEQPFTVRLILNLKAEVDITQSLLYEVTKNVMTYQRNKMLSVAYTELNQKQVVEISGFSSEDEASSLLSFLLEKCSTFVYGGYADVNHYRNTSHAN